MMAAQPSYNEGRERRQFSASIQQCFEIEAIYQDRYEYVTTRATRCRSAIEIEVVSITNALLRIFVIA